MSREQRCQVTADDLERYAMGKMSAEETDRIEDHLLICESCRDRLEETREFTVAMQSASAEIRRKGFGRKAAPLIATAAGIVVTVCAALILWPGSRQAPFALNLIATRGAADIRIPAGRTLDIHPDLTGLTASPRYLLEVVDRDGKRVWSGDLSPPADRATVPGRRAGSYFLRVLAADGKLLREYALEIQ
jgi:hypothetical protein